MTTCVVLHYQVDSTPGIHAQAFFAIRGENHIVRFIIGGTYTIPWVVIVNSSAGVPLTSGKRVRASLFAHVPGTLHIAVHDQY